MGGTKPWLDQKKRAAHSSGNLAVEDALEKDSLGSFCAHVCVGGLLGNKDTTDLAEVGVDLVHFHLDGPLADVKDFVGLLEKLLLAFLAISLQRWKSHRLIVTQVHSAHLRVKETTSPVGRHLELTTPCEAW